MVNAAKMCVLKLIPKSKSNRSLKLLLVYMKANNSILMRLEMPGVAQNKRKCLVFNVVSQVREEDQISDKEERNYNNKK